MDAQEKLDDESDVASDESNEGSVDKDEVQGEADDTDVDSNEKAIDASSSDDDSIEKGMTELLEVETSDDKNEEGDADDVEVGKDPSPPVESPDRRALFGLFGGKKTPETPEAKKPDKENDFDRQESDEPTEEEEKTCVSAEEKEENPPVGSPMDCMEPTPKYWTRRSELPCIMRSEMN